jgi:hypothetical protein
MGRPVRSQPAPSTNAFAATIETGAIPCRPAQAEPKTTAPTLVSPEKAIGIKPAELVDLAPRLAQYIPHGTLTWSHVLDAADWLRGELGVSRSRAPGGSAGANGELVGTVVGACARRCCTGSGCKRDTQIEAGPDAARNSITAQSC